MPVFRELPERLPNPRFYNCYGQSEISPLATVLRPEELNEERLASVGCPALLVETRCHSCDASSGMAALDRVTSTLSTRWPSMSTTSKEPPSHSKRSPVVGTRPR